MAEAMIVEPYYILLILALNRIKTTLNVSLERAATILLTLVFAIFGFLIVLTQTWYACCFYVTLLSLMAWPIFKCIGILVATEKRTRRARSESAPARIDTPTVEEPTTPEATFEENPTVEQFEECVTASTPLMRRRRLSLRELLQEQLK